MKALKLMLMGIALGLTVPAKRNSLRIRHRFRYSAAETIHSTRSL